MVYHKATKMTRYLSFIQNGIIIAQVPTTMTDDEVVALDNKLLEAGFLIDTQEVCIIQDI